MDKVQKGKGPLGSRENPEVYENVPGHVIPILADEFDDFDDEADKFLDGADARGPSSSASGSSRASTASASPTCRWSASSCRSAASPPIRWTPSRASSSSHAPLNKGHITTRQNIQIHHVPLPDDEGADPRDLRRPASPAARAAATRSATSPATRGPASPPTRPSTRPRYAIAYVRYFVRHPTTQLMPRKIKTAFSASDADRAIAGIHDIGFIPRVRDGVKGFEIVRRRRHLDHAADRPDARRVRRRRRRRVPEGHRGRAADLRPPGLAARQPRPRPDQGPRRQDRHRGLPRDGRPRARGRLGRRARLLDRPPARSSSTRRARRPSRPPRRRARRTATAPSSRRSLADNVEPQRQEGFSTVHVKVTRGDLTPEQFRGLGQIMRDFCGGNARTTVDQNFVLRWVRDESLYDVYAALRELGLADDRRRARSPTSSPAPAPTPASSGITASMGLNRALQDAGRGDGDHRSADPQDPPEDERLPERLRPAPHRRRSASTAPRSRSAGTRCPPTSPTSAATFENGEVVYGGRLKVRLPAKRVPDAVERWLRMYEAERNEGEEFNDFATRVGTGRFEDEIRDLVAAGRVQPRQHARVHRLEPPRPLQGRARRGRVRDLMRDAGASTLTQRPSGEPIAGDRGRARSAPGGAAAAGVGADDRRRASRSIRARSTPSSRA